MRAPPINPAHLFTPARAVVAAGRLPAGVSGFGRLEGSRHHDGMSFSVQEMEPYQLARQRQMKPVRALGQLAADSFESVVGSVTGGFTNVLDTLTGAKAARDQREAAIALAHEQTLQVQAQAAGSAQMWQGALPVVGIGAAALIGLMLLMRK